MEIEDVTGYGGSNGGWGGWRGRAVERWSGGTRWWVERLSGAGPGWAMYRRSHGSTGTFYCASGFAHAPVRSATFVVAEARDQSRKTYHLLVELRVE